MELSTKPQNNEYPLIYTHRTANNSSADAQKNSFRHVHHAVHHIIIIMIFWSMLTFFPWAEDVSYFFLVGGQKTAIKVNQDDSHQCIEKWEFFNLTSHYIAPKNIRFLMRSDETLCFCIISRIHMPQFQSFMPLNCGYVIYAACSYIIITYRSQFKFRTKIFHLFHLRSFLSFELRWVQYNEDGKNIK